MEELENQSVNTGEVAEPQQSEQVQETSANTSEVADPNQVQDSQTNAQYADMRRKQELDQYKTRVSEYEQNLDRVAKLSGYNSHQELLDAVAEMEKQQERQQYEQAGIDPDTFNSLLEKHPDIQYAREMKQKQQEQEQFNQQATELFNEFPDLKVEDIKPEVFQLQQDKGLSLLDAYLRTNYKSLNQNAEQQAIQKLTTNQTSSPGSLSGGDVNHTTSIKDMSKDDFESLLRKVKNGEVRSL